MSLVQGGGQWIVWMLMNTLRAEAQPMFPSTPSDDQQLAADSSSNYPHPAHRCPTHLVNKVFLEKWFLRGFCFLGLFCLKLLFVSLLMFSFRVILYLDSSGPVKCGNLSYFCSARPQIIFPSQLSGHLTLLRSRARYLQSLSPLRFPSPRRVLTLEKEVLFWAPAQHQL